MPTVYVDFDDVISETTRSFVSLLHEEYHRKTSYEAIHSFDLKESFGLTDDEYVRFFQRVHEPDIIGSFQPVPGAIETLKKWKQAGFAIAVVTGRLTSAHEASLDWLDRHQVPFDTFTMVDKYGRNNVDWDIAISLEELASRTYCFAVEDSASMAGFLARQMGLPVALIDRPWNRALPSDKAIQRHRLWQDIDRHLQVTTA